MAIIHAHRDGHALRHRRRSRRRPAARGRARHAADLDGRQARRRRCSRRASASRWRSMRCGSMRSMSRRASPARLRNTQREALLRDLARPRPASFGASGTQSAPACTMSSTSTAATPAMRACGPNQILAVSLPYCALTADQMRAVVDACARELLTSHGLRSLSPKNRATSAATGAMPWQRDAAYHMGTVWAGCSGPSRARTIGCMAMRGWRSRFLSPMAQHCAGACVGTFSEIFDGDAPHSARGCFAQAWSVAEILRSWIYLERSIST